MAAGSARARRGPRQLRPRPEAAQGRRQRKAGWRGCRGRTLLDAAALGGNPDVVAALLQAGCLSDVRVVSSSTQRSALHVSLVCGHKAVARRLILAGAHVNYKDPTDRCYPLHVAAAGGHKDLVRDLLIGGANPSSIGYGSGTPLHVAAKLGHDEIVTTLLASPNTDKDAQPGRGPSPLMRACWKGHLRTVKTLLAAGADLTLRTGSRGNIPHGSALDLAALSKRADVVTALLEHGADVNAASADGKTALHRAVQAKQNVGLLLGVGASVHSNTAHGTTPLHIAASLASVKTMRNLLRSGAKVNEPNTSGSTALHLTCAGQQPRVAAAVDLLLRSGASETAVDGAGWTPGGVLERLANRRRCSADEAERARVLLVRAPADRAWRRRCWLVMLRARAEKEKMTRCFGSSSGAGGGDVEQACGRVHDGGEDRAGIESTAGETSTKLRQTKTARIDDGGGSSGGAAREGDVSGLVATLVGLELDGIFRIIVSYL